MNLNFVSFDESREFHLKLENFRKTFRIFLLLKLFSFTSYLQKLWIERLDLSFFLIEDFLHFIGAFAVNFAHLSQFIAMNSSLTIDLVQIIFLTLGVNFVQLVDWVGVGFLLLESNNIFLLKLLLQAADFLSLLLLINLGFKGCLWLSRFKGLRLECRCLWFHSWYFRNFY